MQTPSAETVALAANTALAVSVLLFSCLALLRMSASFHYHASAAAVVEAAICSATRGQRNPAHVPLSSDEDEEPVCHGGAAAANDVLNTGVTLPPGSMATQGPAAPPNDALPVVVVAARGKGTTAARAASLWARRVAIERETERRSAAVEAEVALRIAVVGMQRDERVHERSDRAARWNCTHASSVAAAKQRRLRDAALAQQELQAALAERGVWRDGCVAYRRAPQRLAPISEHGGARSATSFSLRGGATSWRPAAYDAPPVYRQVLHTVAFPASASRSIALPRLHALSPVPVLPEPM